MTELTVVLAAAAESGARKMVRIEVQPTGLLLTKRKMAVDAKVYTASHIIGWEALALAHEPAHILDAAITKVSNAVEDQVAEAA